MKKLIQNKTAFLILLICLFTLTAIAQVPAISSFSPISGPIGSSIIISGSNFDASPANNIVFFGAVSATVTSASATALDVVVPVGASYQPISVTTNGLTAYSVLAFDVTFTPGAPVTVNSFPNIAGYGLNLNAGSSQRLITSDFDGDGKPDVVALAAFDSISVFRNTSSGNNISLAAKKSFAAASFSPNFSVADYDGDGMPDLACVNHFLNTASVFRNTSTVGDISFAPKIDIATTVHPIAIVSGDIDGDGKTDMIISNEDDSSVSVFRNTTVGNNISFAARVDFRTGKRPRYITLADLDGDLKADIISTNYVSSSISILKNTSSPGTVSFDPRTDIATEADPGCINAVDLDGDLKNDLVITSESTHVISAFLNNSTTGNILFAPRVDHIVIQGNIYPPPPPWSGPANTYPVSIASGDVNGDGKPDLYIGCSTDNIYPAGKRVLLINLSSAGNISFAPCIEFPGGPVTSACIIDLQGDSKPEILVVLPNDFSAVLNIYGNRIAEPVEVKLCPPLGNTTIESTLTGTNYQWQVSSDSINFADVNNAGYYSGTNTSSLQLTNIPSSSYGNLYRCIVDGGSSETFGIRFRNEWRWQSTHTQWEDASGWTCGTLPDENTNVVISNIANITLNSNVTIRSLTVLPGATLTIGAGYNLTVLH